MASSSQLLLFLLVLAAAPVPAPAREYCRDTLAGLIKCRSFMFGGAEKPSRACCAAHRAVYDSHDSLCLCYLDDGTFWRDVGYDVDNHNATGESVRIPELCGQLRDEPAPIEFWCEDSEEAGRLPPYGPQGRPAPYVSDRRGRAVPTTGQPPAPSGSSSSSSVAAAPASTTLPRPPPPPASKAKRDSSPESY